ncbi:MAG: ABC transporter permease [Clostridia bacterium]|nr:ABC transporter permease [Clostridia bacterium]
MLRVDPTSGKAKWTGSASFKSIASAVLSILIGLIVGAIIVVIVGLVSPEISNKSIGEGMKLVLFGVLSTGRNAAGQLSFGFNAVNVGNMLFRAMPLLMTGLSVAIAYKTGLFNIGASGQYLMGTTGTITTALVLGNTACPKFIVWILAFAAGVLLGALWGAIPGIFKAYLNINEVITCIMTNWIAANLVSWWFEAHDVFKNAAEGGKVAYTIPLKNVGVVTPKLGFGVLTPGSQANGGFWIACLIAVLMWVVMSKTTFGYELKACGSNRHAAKYAGINDKRNIILSMVIAGALASAGASLYYLSGNTEFYWSTYMSLPPEGFNGIPVALLASNHPIGVIFAGIFMSMLNIAGLQLKYLTPYNEYIADIIIAAIVYLSAFSMLFKEILNRREKKSGKHVGPNANAEVENRKEFNEKEVVDMIEAEEMAENDETSAEYDAKMKAKEEAKMAKGGTV